MSSITKTEVLKLAKLARIHLSNEEVLKYQKEFSSVLKYVDQLSGIDLSDYKPTAQVTGNVNVTRKDEVQQQVSADNLLKNAPHVEDGQFKVRRMIG